MEYARATIYARVSTKDKDQANENQLRELKAFAGRLGYSVYKEYCDQEGGSSLNWLTYRDRLSYSAARICIKKEHPNTYSYPH